MTYFFYFGHPAQFHFYKNIVKALKEEDNNVFLFIKKKDVLEELVKKTGWEYQNILPNERNKSKLSTFLSILKRDIIISKKVIRHRPDLLISSDPSFSHVGYFFRIPCLNFIDDDSDAAGYYAGITYPFSKVIITPWSVKVGRWEKKRIRYKGFMKLAYLHPNWYVPEVLKIGKLTSKGYFLIRLSGLDAHHDSGKQGIKSSTLRTIINSLTSYGAVYISSERPVEKEFEKYQFNFHPTDMHTILFHSKALISDSQSMSGEAAMLGVPSIRISSFKGKLSVLEELEHVYNLTFGFSPDNINGIIEKITELLETPDLDEIFQKRRNAMLEKNIDVTAFCIWFIKNYPDSLSIMDRNPEYADKFL